MIVGVFLVTPSKRQSGFKKSEPCAIFMITKRYPDAQSAWRIDFYHGGYRSFIRPIADHKRELQLSVYCDEKQPGQLFVSMEIQGPVKSIRDTITKASLLAEPISYSNVGFHVEQIDQNYSQVIIKIQSHDVLNFLTKSNNLKITLSVKPPYNTIWANTYLAGSRKALIFAANNCINK